MKTCMQINTTRHDEKWKMCAQRKHKCAQTHASKTGKKERTDDADKVIEGPIETECKR